MNTHRERSTTPECTIREILPQDYEAVRTIWQEEIGGSLSSGQFTDRMNRMKQNDAYKTFVAFIGSDAIGFVITVQTMAIEFETGYLKINGIAVKKAYQRQGIGTVLLEFAEHYARETGYSYIILNSGFQRTAAHAFYEKHDYNKLSYCFTKKLS